MRHTNFYNLSRSRRLMPEFKLIGLAFVAIIFLFAGVARAASPGALDLSFGTRGTAAFRIGSNFQEATTVLVQPDGKIVLGGYVVNCVGPNCSADFLLIRFNADGTPDNSFDTDGATVTDYFGQDETVWAGAVQADGKIVVAGGLWDISNGTNILGFKLVRYNTDGSLDTNFGTTGRVYESFDDQGGTPQAMLIQPDGKIVVAGLQGSMLFTARFNTDGSLDTGFGSQGRIMTNYDVMAVRVARQSDGKILVAARSNPQGTVKLIRFNSNGTPDTTFGPLGVVSTTFADNVTPEIAVQADDKIIVSGEYSNNNDLRIPPLRRFNADGTLDNGFTPDHGQIQNNACVNCTQRVQKVLPLPDGRFYLAGYYAPLNGVSYSITVARYLSNGSIDRTYGFRGASVVRHTNATSNNTLWSVTDAALQPDGKVVVSANSDLPVNNFGQRHELAIRLTATVTPPSMRSDFDGDRKTDFSVFRPSSRFWYVLRSSDGSFYGERYGLDGDVLTPSDYNYDLKTDLSIYRASENGWYINASLPSGGGTAGGVFGQTSDIRVPEDYDGDGYTDLAVFRPSTGTWTVRYRARLLMTPTFSSPTNADETFQFGLGTDKPVPADYDGDGHADFAVFRPSTGDWYILRSSDGIVTGVNFGLGTDKLVPGDYDGDLKTDIAVFRDGAWYILRSSDGAFVGIGWGLATDKPVPGDYDGDGKYDVAVYRASEGGWYVLKSSDGGMLSQQWGISEDIPIPFTFVK